jgi:hypothetical protein
MRLEKRFQLVFAAALVASAFFGACGSEDSGVASNSGTGSTGSKDSGTGGGINLNDGQVDGLVINPPTATIDVNDGVSNPVTFTATLTKSDGTTQPVNPGWNVVGPSIATITPTGSLTATGNLGGEVTVQATYQAMTATATVFINLHNTSNPAGATPGDMQLLEGATTPDTAVQWAYPYDGTAFPQGLTSPRMMWNGGNPDDLYLIKLTGPNADLKYFVKVSPPAQVLLPETPVDLWKQVTDSGKGGKLGLFVARLSAGVATVIANHNDHLASGPLRGTVYYWANSIGRILRIKAGAAAPDDFLAAAGVGGCTACHTVAAKGSRIVIGVDQANDGQSMNSFDLVNNQVKFSGGGRAWSMPAVSADGAVMVGNNLGLNIQPVTQTGLYDVDTGTPIPGSGLDGIPLWMPFFSPDNQKLVYVSPTAPHDLRMYDWDPTAKTFSNDQVIMPVGGDPNLMIGYPTVSPDHEMVIYTRSTTAAWDSRFGNADLYACSTSAPGTEVKLKALGGDTYPFAAGDRDRWRNYEPVMAPLPAGGYFWVVFNSRRTYGNMLTAGPESVKQLWIAAIKTSAAPGEDPSFAAFWLPGQDLNTLNLRGFWALDPCKSNGNSCTDGSECCTGVCVDGVCGETTGCSQDGNACTINADCCNFPGNIACIGGICTQKSPE